MTQDNIPNTENERKAWLLKPENRDPIARRGAGSVYYSGSLSDVKNLRLVVSTRSQQTGGGLAHFGGLGEVEDIIKDDVLATGIQNARREGQEEMEELLGYQPELDADKFVFLYAAKDDGFFIKNGKGFPVDARLHACEMDTALYEDMFPNGETIRHRDPNHKGFQETNKAESFLFLDILKRQDDYHYPHEYFALWVMADKVLNIDITTLIKDSGVDFAKLADKMHTDIATLESYLGPKYSGKLSPSTKKKASPKFG